MTESSSPVQNKESLLSEPLFELAGSEVNGDSYLPHLMDVCFRSDTSDITYMLEYIRNRRVRIIKFLWLLEMSSYMI